MRGGAAREDFLMSGCLLRAPRADLARDRRHCFKTWTSGRLAITESRLTASLLSKQAGRLLFYRVLAIMQDHDENYHPTALWRVLMMEWLSGDNQLRGQTAGAEADRCVATSDESGALVML